MQIRTVLALTNMDEESLVGLRAAQSIAHEHGGANVVVGHVLVPRTLERRASLREFLDENGFHFDPDHIEIEVDSAAVSGVNLLIEQRNPDLVVMSSSRTKGLARILNASVTVGLIGSVDAPVLALQANQELPTFKKVLVAVDGSEQSNRLFQAARALAEDDAEYIGLLVIEDSPLVIGGLDIGRFNKETLQKAREAGEKFLHRLQVDHSEISMHSEVRVGDAPDEIRKADEEHNPDLIVIGTGGIGGKARFILGKVAQSVVGDAEAAVLAVPTHRTPT